MLNLESGGRKRKSVFEVFQKKREHTEERNKTRVFLGDSFKRWRALKALNGIQTDALVAKFLLDSYEKVTGASSAEKPESIISSPTSEPQLNHFEKLTEASSAKKPESAPSSPTSGPLSDQSPSFGSVCPRRCVQKRSIPNEHRQPASIEVFLEEQGEEPVSDAGEADVESDVSEEKSEGSGVDEGNGEKNSDVDWNPSPLYTRSLTANKSSPTETAAAEEERERNGGSDDSDWTPYQYYTLTEEPMDTAVREEDHTETEHRPGEMKLCPECGTFYRKPLHECEHKTKPFVCNICGKRCVSKSALEVHNGVHSETYDHPCIYCHVNFKTRAGKLAHELIHKEQQDPYKCPDCSLTFDSYKKRSEHLNDHWYENQFKCAVCGITFRSKQRVLRHVVVHTGEKAFKCSKCGCRFNQEGHLKSHMRLHTGERPYSCKHCDKSFNHNVSLRSHMQRYH